MGIEVSFLAAFLAGSALAGRDEGEGCENVTVPSSHVGLVSNPLALAALADRLAQDPRDPQPFEWTSCLRRTLVGMPTPSATRG